MGNAPYHTFIYERSLKCAGILTLHDFCLANYHSLFGDRLGAPVEHLRRVVEDSEPGRANELIARFPEWQASPGGIPLGLTRAGAGLCRRVIAAASAVIVHSRWCRDQVRRHYPELLTKVTIIPLGADVDRPTPQARASARARFSLPADALIFGTFGSLASERMNVESIEAFADVSARFPGALLIFVGGDWAGGEPQRAGSAAGPFGTYQIPWADLGGRLPRAGRRCRCRREPAAAADPRRDLGVVARPASPRGSDRCDRHRDLQRVPRHGGPQGPLGLGRSRKPCAGVTRDGGVCDASQVARTGRTEARRFGTLVVARRVALLGGHRSYVRRCPPTRRWWSTAANGAASRSRRRLNRTATVPSPVAD